MQCVVPYVVVMDSHISTSLCAVSSSSTSSSLESASRHKLLMLTLGLSLPSTAATADEEYNSKYNVMYNDVVRKNKGGASLGAVFSSSAPNNFLSENVCSSSAGGSRSDVARLLVLLAANASCSELLTWKNLSRDDVTSGSG